MLEPIITEGECSQLHSLIANAEALVLCCHTNPDGDAMGSMLGLAEILRLMGKKPLMVVPDQFPDFLHWLPNSEKIVRYDKRKEYVDTVLRIADVVFCLDFNTISRTNEMAEALAKTKAKKVLIDHHLNPDIDNLALCISHPEMSSTCEIVFRIAWQMEIFQRLSRQFAVPIYCGMMTDTGGFTFNSNSPEIFYIVSQLLTKKIDKDKIYRNVYHNYSEHRMRLVGHVLCNKLVIDAERHASYFTLTREDLQRFHFIKGDAEGIVNMPLQIKGMKLSISLREDRDKENLVWISLRSVDDFPCNIMAERFFNGGGHLNASGGKLYTSIEEAEKVVKDAIAAFCGAQ